MSSEETVGQQQPPERPEPSMPDDEIDAERDRRQHALSAINMTPGARQTGNIEMLVIEAELVAEGKQLDNPAKPVDMETGEAFAERLEQHEEDLVPAWTRPWEGDE